MASAGRLRSRTTAARAEKRRRRISRNVGAGALPGRGPRRAAVRTENCVGGLWRRTVFGRNVLKGAPEILPVRSMVADFRPPAFPAKTPFSPCVVFNSRKFSDGCRKFFRKAAVSSPCIPENFSKNIYAFNAVKNQRIKPKRQPLTPTAFQKKLDKSLGCLCES